MGSLQETIVYIVDNDHSAQEVLSQIASSAGFCVEQYASAEEFLACFSKVGPACLVLNMQLFGMSGLELQRRLQSEGIEIPIIFFSDGGDTKSVAECFRNGAFDYFEAPFYPEELSARIQAAVEQDIGRWKHETSRRELASRFSRLTDRERQVVEMIYQGYPNKGIAHKLGIKMGTVEYHRSNIMRKLEVDSVPELVRMVMIHKSDGRPALFHR
jgi:FixJ family two-component response regulator